MKNPFISTARSIYIYLLVWLFIAAFYFSLLYWGMRAPLPAALTDSIIFNSLLAGLGLGIWYPSKFIQFQDGRIFRFIVTHLAGSFSAVLLWLTAGYFLVNSVLNEDTFYTEFFKATLVWRILTGILFYFLFLSFYYLINYYTEFQERAKRESELKTLAAEAELRSLKFQINPHFLFNSLNSISSLTLLHPGKAKEMILMLADYLRYTVSDNMKMMNSLEDELKNIRLYLDIEKVRFEEKFEYSEEIDTGCRSILLPGMILQPLVENAIKHAVYDASGKIDIILRCSREGGFLKIVLENNIEGESLSKGAGVGLKNISERLSILYSRRDLLSYKREKDKFSVQLYIPVQNDIIRQPAEK
jgi:two-component system, LytTR family, sensor kinase